MNQSSKFNASKKKNSIVISHIGNDEYLIEGDICEARFIAETGDHDLSVVDIKDGPKISVGKDFLGQGFINRISLLKTNPTEPLLLKIKLAKSA